MSNSSVKVGDLVRHEWKGGSWVGLVVEKLTGEVVIYRPENPAKFIRWPTSTWDLKVISEGR